VASDGRFVGSFSGGCIEAAVAREALSILKVGAGRTVRFGRGSPYIDIRLPCGGGIDLIFTPHPDCVVLAQAVQCLERREPVMLSINESAVSVADGLDTGGFILALVPPLRIIAFGQGEDLIGFAKLASAYGAVIETVTPDERALQTLAEAGLAVHYIYSRSRLPDILGDPWTAHVFLFHDHDWEDCLLPHALALPGFYIGAIGSTRTHQLRLANLAGC
jgi:xanthine dehydrogenase accessory factor